MKFIVPIAMLLSCGFSVATNANTFDYQTSVSVSPETIPVQTSIKLKQNAGETPKSSQRPRAPR